MLKDASPFVKVFMLVLIFAMFVFAVWKLYQLYQMQNSGVTAIATIEGFKEKESNPQSLTNDKMTYAPIFSFNDATGKKITLNSGNFEEEKKYNIGDNVKVFYPKDKPLAAVLEGSFPWKFYGVLAFLGLSGTILLIYYLIYPPTSKF
tara:strand:- start:3812 stop:4255 length:444 start_codon:yes stop_codon:yes gene_type:complete